MVVCQMQMKTGWNTSRQSKPARLSMPAHLHMDSPQELQELFLHYFVSLLTLNMLGSTFTAWKVSKYRVFSSPYFPEFGLNTEIVFSLNYSVRMRENPGQKKLRILTLFTQCFESDNLIKQFYIIIILNTISSQILRLHCTKVEVLHAGFLHQIWPNPQVTFTEENLNGKLYFLCSVISEWLW